MHAVEGLTDDRGVDARERRRRQPARFTPIAPTESVDVLVTDTDTDAVEVDALRERGVEMVLA